MPWDGYDWLDLTYLLSGLGMGLALWLVHRFSKVLAGISEIEESHQSSPLDSDKTKNLFIFNPSSDPGFSSTPKPKQQQQQQQTQQHQEQNPHHQLPDASRLLVEGELDSCQQRVRASRSPVRPQQQQQLSRPKAPTRRSLSLPNGGLSYNDVKIEYKNGHFVAVENKPTTTTAATKEANESASHFDLPSSSQDLPQSLSLNNSESICDESEDEFAHSCHNLGRVTFDQRSINAGSREDMSVNVKDVPKPSRMQNNRRPLLRSFSAAKDIRERGDAECALRAEILALLERGITDPQRLFREAALLLESKGVGIMTSKCSLAETAASSAMNYRSLPRRRHRGQRPISMDEARLGKGWSQSQGSLVRCDEEDDSLRENSPEEYSTRSDVVQMMSMERDDNCRTVKRVNSFSSCKEKGFNGFSDGDRTLSNGSSSSSNTNVKSLENGGRSAMEIDVSSQCIHDDSKSDRSRSKGPGFIQRMLQKRKGTSASSEKPLAISISKPFATRQEALDYSSSSASPNSAHEIVLSSTTASTATTTTTTTTSSSSSSPSSHQKRNGEKSRDSSVSRRMSLRNIFKRKNSSSDLSASKLVETNTDATATGDRLRSVSSQTLDQNHISSSSSTAGRVRRDSDTLSYIDDEISFNSSALSQSTSSLFSASSCSEMSLNRAGLASPEIDCYFDVFTPGSSATLPSKGRRSRSVCNPRRQGITSPSSSSLSSSSFNAGRMSTNSSFSQNTPPRASGEPRLGSYCSDNTLNLAESHLSPGSSEANIQDVYDTDTTLTCPETPKASQAFSFSEMDNTLIGSPWSGFAVGRGGTTPSSSSPRRNAPGKSSCSKEIISGLVDGVTQMTSDILAEENRTATAHASSISLHAYKGEITSSNSNDSGIQRDVSMEAAGGMDSLQSSVRLRHTSPAKSGSERPKSDVSVHWADLLQENMVPGGESSPALPRRRDPSKLSKGPRPKSDIEDDEESAEQDNDDNNDKTKNEREIVPEENDDNCHPHHQQHPYQHPYQHHVNESEIDHDGNTAGGWRSLSKTGSDPYSSHSNGSSSSFDLYGVLQNSLSTSHVPDEVDRNNANYGRLQRMRSAGSGSDFGSTKGRNWISSGSTSSRRVNEANFNMRSGDSVLSLLECSRRGQLSVSAALAKIRRMSTPQPIVNLTEKPEIPPAPSCHLTVNGIPNLVRSRSMPENLDGLRRKKRNYFGLMAPDAISMISQNSLGDGDSSDESEYSVDFHHPGSRNNSHLMLAALDQMLEDENLTYAEALWDHVTLDPDELGFRAGDLIRVLDMSSNKHWWYGLMDGMQGWFPATFVRLRINQDGLEDEMASLLFRDGMLMDHHHGGICDDNCDFRDSREEDEGIMDGMRTTTAGTTTTTAVVRPSLTHSAPLGVVDKQQARANVVKEIIHAEREYVKHLRNVVEGYVKNARKRPEMFPPEKVTTIFANVEDIYNFALDLLNQLEECVDQQDPYQSELGQCFLDHSKGFEMYSDYCNNHPAACDELRELYRNKRYRHFFEACRLLQDMIEIPLEGFLLTPVQKICKYHLQLAELLKFTPATHGDHDSVKGALDTMKRIATLINERKRKMESIEKLAAWQLAVDDWEGPDILEKSSESIYSGELVKINPAGWSQYRSFFLFDHQLIYTKKDRFKRGSYGFKGRIDMDNCKVISIPDGRDSQYGVSVHNAWKLHETTRDKWYLLEAKTPQLKQRWLKAFQDERKRVKEDAENDFNIPAHVKQSAIASIKNRSSLHKPKSNKFTRAYSASTLDSESHLDIGTFATLPRNKSRHKLKTGGGGGGGRAFGGMASMVSRNKLSHWLFHGKDNSKDKLLK